MSEMLLDRTGRRRSPATMPSDPPKVEEIVAVMRTAGDGAHGRRLRGLIVVLWRAGLRIRKALALATCRRCRRLLDRRAEGRLPP